LNPLVREGSTNAVIAAQIQSLAGAISATTDPGPALSQAKKDLEDVVADILSRNERRLSEVID
jgi:hypothetical protein